VFICTNKRKPTHDGQCSGESADVHTPKKKSSLHQMKPSVIYSKNWTEDTNKPMLFKILHPYHEEFIPKLSLQDFPEPITEMYNPANWQ